MRRWVLLVVLLFSTGASAAAQTAPEALRRLSLEQLLNIEITTVARVGEPISDVAAAVFVITRDDIRRSGANSIPEVLRLAPGLQVARINGGTWSIGVRGFADRLARSVLVLIDGRAVYSPLFAGTYWENQDTFLGDIERIEVIRGPGGTLWGTNAVNGIINIITRQAQDTQGTLFTAGGGSQERAFGALRYGGARGQTAFRVYGKALDRGPQFHADGADFDGWRSAQGGFRIDRPRPRGGALTLQGDAYAGRLGQRTTLYAYQPPFAQQIDVESAISGGNVLARLSTAGPAAAGVQLQVYYDVTDRREQPVGERRQTFDVDFLHRPGATGRHALIWGAGYRISSGRISAVATSSFLPDVRTDALYSAFVQDDVALGNRWRLSAGTKVQHNPYSGLEWQPSARVAWLPARSHTVWGAVTRAVRIPSRVETDYTTTAFSSPGEVPVFVRLTPNPDFTAERLIAYESGYRAQIARRASVTVSAFVNDLRDTLSTDLLPRFVEDTPPPARLITPVTFSNTLHGTSRGLETTADVRVREWWRLTGSYTYTDVQMSRDADSRDVSQERNYEGVVARHQWQGAASFDLRRWTVDGTWRAISARRAPVVPAYGALTLRVGRQIGGVELSLVGQDLLSDHHREWSGPAEIQRSIYARATWRR
jgi:iron complex outermembrane receptor protein